jgi:hypothetical protein
MAAELLVDERIEGGKALVEQLIRDGFDPAVAFWAQTADEGLWHLYIASNAVSPEKIGEAYGVMDQSLHKLPEPQVSFSEIKLVHPTSPLAAAVIAVRDRQNGSWAPIRYHGTSLGRLDINEVDIYPKPSTRFLVESSWQGAVYLVFTWHDPRQDGYSGPLTEGVILDYDMEHVTSWPRGHPRPEACVGRSPKNAKHYKVFKYRTDLQGASFEPVPGVPLVFGRWSEYARLTDS